MVVGGAMEVSRIFYSPIDINTAKCYTLHQSNSTARGGNTFRANKTFEKKQQWEKTSKLAATSATRQ